jgi:hypothetical protein
MSYKNLRIKLKLKRELLKKIGYHPGNYVNLYRAEKSNVDFAEKIENYSEITSQVFYDPRSERNIGHTFNSRDVFKLTNVIVEPRQGIIYSRDGKLVSESTNWSTSNLYESFPWNPKKVNSRIEAKNVINLTSNAFGHWLVEDLGSILYLIDRFPNSPVLVYKNASRFVLELLKILDREVIFCDGPTRINSILMVTKQQDSGWMHPKDLDILEKFKDRVLTDDQRSLERIYATRRLLKRSPKNENAIENAFKNHKFTVIQMEDINLIDEINLVNSTKILAGVSGSWHFNSIWMKRSAQIIDIANENYWTELIHRVCTMKSIDYKWFIYGGDFNSQVNLKNLEDFLNKVILN